MRRAAATALAVAVAYFVVGRLALLLAIPPGYASPVWPAAGVALVAALRVGAARALPGILLGSFAVNATHAPPTASTGLALVVALAIAVGATLQAGAGAAAIRRLIARPIVLERGRDIVVFLLLAGPASCVINATVGGLALGLAGLQAWSAAPFAWWTWWVGDAIGAMVFAPLLLAFVGEPRASWRSRVSSIAIPLALGFVVVTTLFVRTSGWERDRLRAELTRRATVIDRALARSIDRYSGPVILLAAFYGVSDEVSAEQFAGFTAPIMARRPGLVSLSWSDRVEGSQRAAYEEAVARELGRPFVLWAHATGPGRPAAPRDDYYAIRRVAPVAGNERLLGFDAMSEPLRHETLARALASGEPSATPPIALLQDGTPTSAVVVMMVVRRGGVVRGVAAAAFRVRTMVDDSVAGLDRTGLAVEILDEGVAGEPGEQVAYRDPGVSAGAPAASISRQNVGGRHWLIRIVPAGAGPPRSWQSWLVMAGGLSILAILGGVLLLVTARASRSAAAERDQLFLLQIGDAMRACRDEAALLAVVTRKLAGPLALEQCFFTEVDLDGDRFTVHPGFHRATAPAASYRLSSFSPSTQAELRAGITVTVDDAAHDPRTAARYAESYAASGFRALLGVPLLVEGRWRATLWAIDRQPRAWQPREITLAQAVAERAWFWAGHLRQTVELERRVGERTHALEASLRDKDVLMREIHHRVKNNLQVVSSLLYMQAARSGDPQVREVLGESRERVQSIALVHDQLYRAASDATSIELHRYLEDLVRSLARAQQTPQVHVVLDAASLRLPLDQAVSCGLIVNELLSNALKHGFPDQRAGTVTITARPDDGHAVVIVRDDGVGLPADFDPRARSRTGLGMVVVVTLAAQLGGTLTVAREPSTTFEIRFPLAT